MEESFEQENMKEDEIDLFDLLNKTQDLSDIFILSEIFSNPKFDE